MRDQAQRLDENQKKLSEQLETASKDRPRHSLRDTRRAQAGARRGSTSSRRGSTSSSIRCKHTVQDAEETEPLLAKNLFDTVRKAERTKDPRRPQGGRATGRPGSPRRCRQGVPPRRPGDRAIARGRRTRRPRASSATKRPPCGGPQAELEDLADQVNHETRPGDRTSSRPDAAKCTQQAKGPRPARKAEGGEPVDPFDNAEMSGRRPAAKRATSRKRNSNEAEWHPAKRNRTSGTSGKPTGNSNRDKAEPGRSSQAKDRQGQQEPSEPGKRPTQGTAGPAGTTRHSEGQQGQQGQQGQAGRNRKGARARGNSQAASADSLARGRQVAPIDRKAADRQLGGARGGPGRSDHRRGVPPMVRPDARRRRTARRPRAAGRGRPDSRSRSGGTRGIQAALQGARLEPVERPRGRADQRAPRPDRRRSAPPRVARLAGADRPRSRSAAVRRRRAPVLRTTGERSMTMPVPDLGIAPLDDRGARAPGRRRRGHRVELRARDNQALGQDRRGDPESDRLRGAGAQLDRSAADRHAAAPRGKRLCDPGR